MTALADNLQRVADVFERRVDEMAVEIVSQVKDRVAELRDLEAPELWEAMRRVTRDTRRSQADHLRSERRIPTTCLEPDAEAARGAARIGLSMPAVLQCFRIGHAVSLEAWLDAVESLDLARDQRRECLRAVARFALAYDDRVMELVTDEYKRARARDSGVERRVKLVRELIEGTSDDATGLDYDLDLEHLGVIGWGPGAEVSIHRLAAALDRRALLAPLPDDLVMGWLGSTEQLEAHGRRELGRFVPPGGAYLSVGNPHSGLEGFRRTHRQAGEAHLVAVRRPKPVTLYADVALEAFALRDESVARDFVASELAPLNDGDGHSARLRETLQAYFDASQNAAATAAALGVHEQTVARRIRAAEALIGSPLNRRRAELELALRLDELLNSERTGDRSAFSA